MTRTYTQDEVDARSRELITRKLESLMAAYDGTDGQAREILRGLVAAQRIGIDLRDFAPALSKLSPALDAA
jgi:hypothetical protein